jgi:hypothetical protein
MSDLYEDGRGPPLKHQQPPPPQRPSLRLKPTIEVENFINLLHGSDPVRVELTRLENELQCMLSLGLCTRSHPPTTYN